MPTGKNKIRVVIDVNIWVSFAIGKRCEVLSEIVLHPLIEIYASAELVNELKDVFKKPKLKKIISKERAKETLLLLKQSAFILKPFSVVRFSRDSADDYLLEIAKDCNADYLITGDKDLLVLNKFQNVEIINLDAFVTRIL